VKSLIIDLRDNGGGYVDAAEECLALLNKKDTVLYMIKTKNGKVTKVKDATDDHYQFEQGLILVNNMSASASEIMASSLKKNNNYTIVGEKTYGKGTVQVEMPLANGGVLKYTYAKWLTPDGTSINKVGIVPNVEISDAPLAKLQLEKVPATYHFDQLNDYIKTMEIMLDALGYKPGRTDGYFSKDAQNALKAFQKKEHLKESGNYDQESYYHLLSAYVYAVGTKSYDPIYSKALSMLK
jgi:carboxyl-terminal processing protease